MGNEKKAPRGSKDPNRVKRGTGDQRKARGRQWRQITTRLDAGQMEYCADTNSKRYFNEALARKAAQEIVGKRSETTYQLHMGGPRHLDVYECDLCGSWHLTSTPLTED